MISLGVMTVKINDELEAEFRRKVALVYGAGKGVLSRALEDAIRLWLESVGKPRGVKFYAYKDGEKVAESDTLEGLAEALRSRGLSVREVVIVSSDEPEFERLGFRARRV